MNSFIRRSISFVLVFAMLILPFHGFVGRAEAATVTIDETYTTPRKGTVEVPTSASAKKELNARSDARSDATLVQAIPSGTVVEVIGRKKYSDQNSAYYRIRFTGTDGKTKEAYGYANYIIMESLVENYSPSKKGYVDYSPLTNVRTGPNQSYAILKDAAGKDVGLVNGTKVEVLARVGSGTGGAYYKCNIQVDGKTVVGYLYADFVRIYTDPTGDDAFVAELKKQGFPDSYIEPLRILHAQHPAWTFIADQTGLDWETALTEESAFQRALVNYVSPTSWKRLDDYGYTWLTSDGKDGGFKKLDGFHWEAANKTSTAYFMDPRNWLTESEMFQFELQSFDESIHTLERVQNLLADTFMEGVIPGEYKWAKQTVVRDEKTGKILRIDTVEDTSANKKPLTYAEVFLESARISGVSPDMLVARVIQEMGTEGTSQIISGVSNTAPGHYNYYDFGTYAEGSMDAITRGLKYAKGDYVKEENWAAVCLPWNTRWKSLYGGAIMIGRDYISRGQDTLYYQKFNVKPGSTGYALYSHQYMTNIQAPANEARTMWQACPDKDAALIFKIPVYNNMPAELSVYPGNATGNPNAYLKSLSVDGWDLTPAFSYKSLSYDIVVNENTNYVVVNAEAIAASSKVTGAGKITLKDGNNEIKITVTAEYGNQQVYVIDVYRPGPELVSEVEHIKTTYILDGDYLWGVEPGTTVEQFLAGYTVVEGNKVKVMNPSGEVVTTGPIGTGYVIKTPLSQYTVVIIGDVNRDGEISIFDMLYIKRQMLGLISLDESQQIAANVKEDESIDIFDMLYIKRHMLSLYNIAQPKGEETTYGPEKDSIPK